MNSGRSEVEKVAYLDGLRGVAALIVLFAHLMIALFPAVITFTAADIHTSYDMDIGLSPISFIWRGNFAVCVFFVISGFVLSEFSQKTRISFPAQIVRRYLRLAIPMLITSTFAWLLLYLGLYVNLKAAVNYTHSGWLSTWYQFEPDFVTMVKESVFYAFKNGSAAYNSNLWTMKIEFIGSIYVFLLHVLFKNRNIRLLGILWLLKVNVHHYFALFAWGAFLYDFRAEIIASFRRLLPNQQLRNAVLAIGFAIGVYLGAFPEIQPGMFSPWYLWWTKSRNVTGFHMLGAMLVVLFLLDLKLMQTMLSGPKAKFLGKISFVLYLIHLPIICSLTSALVILTGHLPYLLSAPIVALITVAVVLGVSFYTYKYVDLYTTQFSRWVGAKFDLYFGSDKVSTNIARNDVIGISTLEPQREMN